MLEGVCLPSQAVTCTAQEPPQCSHCLGHVAKQVLGGIAQ